MVVLQASGKAIRLAIWFAFTADAAEGRDKEVDRLLDGIYQDRASSGSCSVSVAVILCPTINRCLSLWSRRGLLSGGDDAR